MPLESIEEIGYRDSVHDGHIDIHEDGEYFFLGGHADDSIDAFFSVVVADGIHGLDGSEGDFD